MIYPKTLMVESTNMCNSSCIFCGHEFQTTDQGCMSIDLFNDICDESRARFAWLHFYGEPTLSKNLVGLAEVAKEHNIHTGIVTNGARLTPYLTNKLIELGMKRIIISLGGSDKETYEFVWRGLKYESTWENTKYAIEVARRTNTRITVRFILTKENVKQRFKMFKEWSKYTLDMQFVNEFRVKDRQGRVKLSEFRFKNCKLKGRLFDECCVKWNGLVVPCCMDYDASTVVGDASKENLLDIWNGDDMNAFRKAVYSGVGDKPKICATCYAYPKGLWRLF